MINKKIIKIFFLKDYNSYTTKNFKMPITKKIIKLYQKI
jgi:hypothetical protein